MKKSIQRTWYLDERDVRDALVAFLKAKDEPIGDQAFLESGQGLPSVIIVTERLDVEPSPSPSPLQARTPK